MKESSTDNSTDASSNLNRRPKQFDGSGDGNTDLDKPEGIYSGGQIHNRLLFDYQWFKLLFLFPAICCQQPILAQTTRSFAIISINNWSPVLAQLSIGHFCANCIISNCNRKFLFNLFVQYSYISVNLIIIYDEKNSEVWIWTVIKV